MDERGDCAPSGVSIHGIFVVILFACIFYVCIFLSEDTLLKIQNQTRQLAYRTAYRWCAGVMIVSVILAVASRFLPSSAKHTLCEHSFIFWLEAISVWAFSAFWYIKTRELDPTMSWVPFRRKAETSSQEEETRAD